MEKTYYAGNRSRMYEQMQDHAMLVMFSGREVRKTNDEFYPFFADRNFVYLTGIEQKESVLLAVKEDGKVKETLFLLPKDAMAERWTGRRLSAEEAEAISGISDIRPADTFDTAVHTILAGGHYSTRVQHLDRVYLDLYRADTTDRETPVHGFLRKCQTDYAFLTLGNANEILRKLRLIKQPCEIAATRKAETITRDGILACMRAARDGIWEYQLKARFDEALAMHSPDGPGFPSIISGGSNNFCIHYYCYRGQVHNGDMILNDVGAHWDHMITDVSRSYPCSGHFTDRQKLLYECALATSNHMFETVRPGMRMDDVDRTIRQYNAEMLKAAGVIRSTDEIGTYMWHGGAHHIGYDVHDAVARPEIIGPNMMFCIDVGIYHEAWGIGFRLEDNCLVTEDGCENLSAIIPRTVEDIEAAMRS
ncbi:MAG: aminopeptidase P N-terminal domain-containing protein [Clostridia bacterium]|nr:aminopeptidase P N-terminal domain-containing protein [Clostridia bacterium]